MHHPALAGIQSTVARIATVPIGDSQSSTWFQNPQKFVCELLLIRHVWACFHTPNPVEFSVRKIQVQCVHDLKAAGQVVRR